jgi:hypothetical protein
MRSLSVTPPPYHNPSLLLISSVDMMVIMAGGSEIMHLAPHKGKLHAANGYWKDSHSEIPEGEPKQSTQVLRLDSSGGLCPFATAFLFQQLPVMYST